jgi:hypothetical protein
LASAWVPFLVGGMVFVLLVTMSVVVAGLLLWRFGLRRWRLLRSHHAVVGAGVLWTAVTSRYVRSGPAHSPSDIEGRPARAVRKEMWRSVDRAASAVRAADVVGAPTAELPSLCRRLQDAATDLDKVLRVDPAARLPAALCEQVVEVLRAADDVQQAAVASAGEASGQRVRELTEDARNECTYLDAGLASFRSAGATSPRSTGLPPLPG